MTVQKKRETDSLQKPYLIVGIDPGNTVGIAIIDLEGRKIALHSIDGGAEDIAKIIEKHGTPSLIACDVNPPPEAVLKIASFFSCRAFYPEREIREEEKREMARGFGTKNSHERDAFCSAVMAYRNSMNKLRQIEALGSLSKSEKEKIKHLILKGYRARDAIEETIARHEKGIGDDAGQGKETPKNEPKKGPCIDSLWKRISALSRENANLRLLSERLEKEKESMADKARLLESAAGERLRRDSEIRKLRYKIKILEGQLRMKRKGPWKNKKDSNSRIGEKEKNHTQEKNETGNNALNILAGSKVNLKELVEEYRKGRD